MAWQSPKGTRDFFPADLAALQHVEKAWRSASINAGFDEIEGFIDEIKKFHRDTIQTGAPVTTSSIAAKTQQAGLWNLRAIELKEDYESLLLLKAAADTNEAELKKTQGKIIGDKLCRLCNFEFSPNYRRPSREIKFKIIIKKINLWNFHRGKN